VAATKRRTLEGIVHSDRMHKTITVDVETRTRDATYGKFLRRTRRFMVHDEREEAGPGDRVEIEETRPLSRNKHWRLLRVVGRGHAPEEAAP